MDTSEEVEHNVLCQVLDKHELEAIPSEILAKIKNHLRSKHDEFIAARAIVETEKQNLEKKLDEIQKAIKEKQDMGTSMNEKDFMVQAGSSETIMENPEVKLQLEIMEKRVKELEEELQNERKNIRIQDDIATNLSDLLKKVENLNALSDSNRMLRHERDSIRNILNGKESKIKSLMEEMISLRQKIQEISKKVETLTQENESLRNEATRWRLRANTLIEKPSSKAAVEDWKKVQAERDNLSKMLTVEREASAKRLEEWKGEKNKLEEQITGLQRQLKVQGDQFSHLNEEYKRLGQDLIVEVAESNSKSATLAAFQKDLSEKDIALNDSRNKESQIRKIAKKYKTQYEELSKQMEDEKAKSEKLSQANKDLAAKIYTMTGQLLQSQTECENLKKTMLEKGERSTMVLKGARAKITQLNDAKKYQDKEINDLKSEVAAKAQLETRLLKMEQETFAEKQVLLGKIEQLQMRLSSTQAENDSNVQQFNGLKRPLTLDLNVTELQMINETNQSEQEQLPSLKSKRIKQEMQSPTEASVSGIGNQEKISSELDLDEKAKEDCLVIDCEEEDMETSIKEDDCKSEEVERVV